MSFIAKFTNLQELVLLLGYDDDYKGFEKLQYVTFSQLQILKIQDVCPRFEILINFLENNGKNLKKFYVGELGRFSDNSLNLAIAKFCPNLRKLSAGFKNNELETLKIISNNCQYLESIKIWCGVEYLSEKEALDTVIKYMKYSPNLYKLKLYYLEDYVDSELLPEELESFFISWTNRIPQKSLSLVIYNFDSNENSLDTNNENMEIIKKYTKLGVIKKFKVV